MNNYVKTYEYDFIHDTQKVFRSMLSALSNPGKSEDIGEQVRKFKQEHGALAVMGYAVLDNEKTMYVEKNQELSETMHDLTLCREDELNRSDYIFLSSEVNYESVRQIFKNAKKGTYADPHQSATVFFYCDSLEGEESVVLSGPGIDGVKILNTTLYIKNILQIRQELDVEFPLGIDFFLATKEGKLMGFPRLCKIDEERR